MNKQWDIFQVGRCGLHVLGMVFSGIGATSHCVIWRVDAKKKLKFVWGYPSNTVQCCGQPSFNSNGQVLTVLSTIPSTW